MSRKAIDWHKYYEMHQDFKVWGLQTVILKKEGQEAITRFAFDTMRGKEGIVVHEFVPLEDKREREMDA